MITEKEKNFFKECYLKKKLGVLCKYIYCDKDLNFNSKQMDIINSIIYKGNRRLLINGHTRFGKSFTLGAAIGLYILFNNNKKVIIGAPQESQTKFIRGSFNSFLNKSVILRNLLSTNKRNINERDFESETSKTTLSFKNGCKVICQGFGKQSTAALGAGADLLIIDEFGLLDRDVFEEKVFRLLGDNPETSMLICLFNPWSKDSIAYDLWINVNYKNIHIDYKYGLEVGRLTPELLEEQRNQLTERNFCVLYKSNFPDVSDEVLLTPEEILSSFYRKKVTHKKEHLNIGVDVARFGSDETVITFISDYVEIYEKIIFDKSSITDITTKLINIVNEKIKIFDIINLCVDDDGVGGGLSDNLENNFSDDINVNIIKINNGSKPQNDRFKNKTTELWFFVKENITKLSLIRDNHILKELSKRKYSFLIDGKIMIESKCNMKKRGLKSPDRSDSLAYALSPYVYETNTFIEPTYFGF